MALIIYGKFFFKDNAILCKSIETKPKLFEKINKLAKCKFKNASW